MLVTTGVQRDSLTEGYEEFAVAAALVGRQCEDAGYIVAVRRLFLLKSIERKALIFFFSSDGGC